MVEDGGNAHSQTSSPVPVQKRKGKAGLKEVATGGGSGVVEMQKWLKIGTMLTHRLFLQWQ